MRQVKSDELKKNSALKVRFLSHTKIEKETGCWLWTAARYNYSHYGQAYISRKVQISAHRLSYLLFVGDIGEGLYVLHHCDVPLCVNPAHLFTGTHFDNMRDMSRKGRNVQSKKMECPAGHPYEGENLRIYRGRRYCRTCVNSRRRIPGARPLALRTHCPQGHAYSGENLGISILKDSTERYCKKCKRSRDIYPRK